MTLDARIRAVDPERAAVIGPSGKLSFGALAGATAALQGGNGAKLLLNLADPVDALRLLIALDGRASALVLTSSALDAEVVHELAREAECDAIVSSRTDLSGTLPVIAPGGALPDAGDTCGATAWIMTTSGTTGRPKMVAHSLGSLTRTTRADTGRGAGQVWGLLYDWSRFAGMQVVLQSLLSGATLALPPEGALAERLDWLAQAGVTHLSATPTLWRKILMTPAQAMPLQQITLGGEIADDAVLAGLSKAYPGARICHIFASTEAGAGFSVTDGRAGFPAEWLQSPPWGIGLMLRDGRLHLRNELVGAEYLGGQGTVAEGGWVDTGDMAEIRDGRVVFLGRASGVINVGGDKVHPEEVERAVLSHPKVRLARVYAKSNPITGALVAVDIVAGGEDDPKALREELKTYLSARLSRHMVPAFFRFVSDFDMNAAGKLKRTD